MIRTWLQVLNVIFKNFYRVVKMLTSIFSYEALHHSLHTKLMYFVHCFHMPIKLQKNAFNSYLNM